MKKILLLFVVFSGLLLTSCYKDPANGIARITVVDVNAFKISAANVQLTGPTGSYINESGITNFKGEWEYIHDPALEVILQVHVTSSTGPEFGDGIIRIEPDETATVTIIIQ